ncbi:MAG: peptidase [Bacteroidetes bacterium]|nr:peptidase [Bacteroidota bacterium]
MKKAALIILLTGLAPAILFSQTQQFTNDKYKEDFDFFWKSINDEYCYFGKKQTDWEKVKEIYAPMIDTIKTRDQFVNILEKAIYEIYDHHAGLNTNTDNSQRVVPTGTDIWAEYINGKPVITEVRPGLGATSCGITTGMEIIAINEEPVNNGVERFLPKSAKHADVEAKNFALRILIAGNHIQPRKISLKYNGAVKDYFPDKDGFLIDKMKYPSMVETKFIGTIGYIRINNFLFDNDLIPAFDSAMQLMNNTTALIIDMRETPSGGNTSVARAILGWFTDKEKFYQKHEYYAEEKQTGIKRSWEEIVSPRKGKYYNKPLVVLCDHWTGSIAEGITIGFDGLHRPNTKTLGTAMARLNGAVYGYEMPNTKIHFSFPAERLYHVNGLPREQYIPSIYIDFLKEHPANSSDLFIEKALAYLKSLK